MANTTHLGIPLLEASQAQKEVTINEALTRLDAMILGAVMSRTTTTPPASPAVGDVYIVPASATGVWSAKAPLLAYFDQVWRFITPTAGFRVWVQDIKQYYVFNGTAWVISSEWSTDSSDILAASNPLLGSGQILKSYNTAASQKIEVAQVNSSDYLQIGHATSNLNGIKVLPGTGGGVSIGSSNANSTAVLDVQSTSKGVLLPRMTTSQKNAISSPAEGLSVYDTKLHSLSVYNGTAWVEPGGVDTTAWASYTPTVTASSGTYASASATGAYKQIGKTTFVRLTATITSVGSASGAVLVTLPASAQAAGYILMGRENGVTGKMLQGFTTGANTTLNVFCYDATSAIASGAIILINGSYQAS